MTVQLNFDATTVQPSSAPEAVPAGWYPVAIVDSELRPTKDKTSQYLYLELQILEGPHAGQKIFDRLNLWHSNPTTQRIAQEQLSGYCHATGVLQVGESGVLHNRPFEVKVNHETDPEGKYEPSNNVKDRRPVSGATANAAAPAAPQAPTAPPAAPAAPPAAPQGWNAPPAQAPTAPGEVPFPPAQAPAVAPPSFNQAAPPQAGQPPAQVAPPQPPAQAAPTPPWAQQ